MDTFRIQHGYMKEVFALHSEFITLIKSYADFALVAPPHIGTHTQADAIFKFLIPPSQNF